MKNSLLLVQDEVKRVFLLNEFHIRKKSLIHNDIKFCTRDIFDILSIYYLQRIFV